MQLITRGPRGPLKNTRACAARIAYAIIITKTIRA